MKNKKIICLAVLATLFCLNRNDFTSVSAEPVDVGTFNSYAWKNYNNTQLNPDRFGNVTCSNGRLFCGDKYPVSYDSKENTMTVSIDFSFTKENDKYLTYNWVPLLSSTEITQDTDYYGKIGKVDTIIGFMSRYDNETDYNKNRFRFSSSAGNGTWKNDFYTTLNPKDGAKHNLTFVLDETGIYSTFDGNVIVAKGSTNPYYFVKSDSSKYTVNDFIVDGQPSVYFAIDTAQNFATTVYRPTSDNKYDFDYTTFDDSSWFNWNNVSLKPSVGGNVYCSNGKIYNKSKMPVSFDEKTGEMSVDITWSFIKNNDDKLTYQWRPLITSKPITMADDYANKIGTVNDFLGFRCFYKDGTDHGNGKFRVSACSGKGNWLDNYYPTINPTNNAKHTLTFVMNEFAVYAKLDGSFIVKSDSSNPYYFLKSSGEQYTIKDFIVDGQPSVYFAIDDCQNYATTIYKPESLQSVEFDSTKWKSYTGANYFNPQGFDAINGTNAMYYDDKLTVIDFNKETNVMRVGVDFSINCPIFNSTDNQIIPFFTSEEIDGNWSAAQARIGAAYSVPTISARMYYQSESRYNSKSLIARACDYANYETSDYVTANPTDNAVHTISLVMTSTYIYMEFDGITLTKDGSAYKLAKDASGSNLYTIEDFLKDGEPSVYFGIFKSANFGEYQIHNSVSTIQNHLDTYGTHFELAYRYELNNDNSFESFDVRMMVAVESMEYLVSKLDPTKLTSYGVKVTCSGKTLWIPFGNAKTYQETIGGKDYDYAVLIITNVTQGDFTRFKDEFTISAYVDYDGAKYVSAKSSTTSAKDLVEELKEDTEVCILYRALELLGVYGE